MEYLKEPKVVTIPLEQIIKMSSVILKIPTNLLDKKEKYQLKSTIL